MYFFTGKIKAVQLEYTEAFSRLMQSIRKAPDTTALGFRVQAQKLAIVVELLLVILNQKINFMINCRVKYLEELFFLKKSLESLCSLISVLSKVF